MCYYKQLSFLMSLRIQIFIQNIQYNIQFITISLFVQHLVQKIWLLQKHRPYFNSQNVGYLYFTYKNEENKFFITHFIIP